MLIVATWRDIMILGERGKADPGFICIKRPRVIQVREKAPGIMEIKLQELVGKPEFFEAVRSDCGIHDVGDKEMAAEYMRQVTGLYLPGRNDIQKPIAMN